MAGSRKDALWMAISFLFFPFPSRVDQNKCCLVPCPQVLFFFFLNAWTHKWERKEGKVTSRAAVYSCIDCALYKACSTMRGNSAEIQTTLHLSKCVLWPGATSPSRRGGHKGPVSASMVLPTLFLSSSFVFPPLHLSKIPV